jgi:hypothetical protein
MFSYVQQSNRMGGIGIILGAVAATCLAVCFALGCGAAGALIYKVSPAPKVAAVYKLPSKPILVLVENYRNPGVSDQDAERLGREITDQLRQHKIGPVIDPDKLFEYRQAKGSAFDQMTIAAVGKAMGAGQVLYVDLVDYGGDWTLGSDLLHPKAQIRVRVVDVATGNTAWPSEAARGFPMTIEMQYAEIKNTETEIDEQEAICQTTADHVVKLFYTHESEEISQNGTSALAN